MKAEKAKIEEIEAQEAKMKGKQSPTGQNERKARPNRPKCRESKAQQAKIARGAPRAKTFGFRVFTFDRQCGGDRPRCHSMAATAQLDLGLDVRVFQPLAQLGPLRALTASVRALSETLGFRVYKNC